MPPQNSESDMPERGRESSTRRIYRKFERLTGLGSIAALIITFLVHGLNAGLAKALDDTGIPTIWQVMVLTAPLTGAIALITMIFVGGDTGYTEVVSVPFIFIGAAFVTHWLGLNSGKQISAALDVEGFNDPNCDPCAPTGMTWETMAASLFVRYWHLYGPGLILSSVLVGVLIGFIWLKVLSYFFPD